MRKSKPTNGIRESKRALDSPKGSMALRFDEGHSHYMPYFWHKMGDGALTLLSKNH